MNKPSSVDLADSGDRLSRGTNQSGARLYNERLLLSLIRRHGSLPKAVMSRLTGLSAQTISVIVKQLEADGLLIKQEPQRGRIGQPSVPFALNPEGAFALGLKLGRRSADLILLDCVGSIRDRRQWRYRYPVPDELLDVVGTALSELTDRLPETKRKRIAGLGIAMPFELWNWEEGMDAPPEVLVRWRDFDMRAVLQERCPWPVYLCNDATAACAAELVFGKGHQHLDFIYCFISAFVGGGVVLDSSLYPGRSGNAGALGSMLVSDSRGQSRQLIRNASLFLLEEKLAAAGHDPELIWQAETDWKTLEPLVGEWIDEAAAGIAQALVAACAVIDFQAAIIDGALPPEVRSRLVGRIGEHMDACDRRGLSSIVLQEGSIGAAARAIGGASLPLLASFALDREVLFKEAAT